MNYFKNPYYILLCLFLVVGCNESKKVEAEVEHDTKEENDISYASFGMPIQDEDALNVKSMTRHYENMNLGDSINAKFRTSVNEVCQAKGCWMKAELLNGEEVMVKFKDYGFFVPKDISGKEIVINGVAFVNEVPVDEQRHYAEDEGLSDEEIAAIKDPKKTFSFLADGVLVREN